MKRAVWTALGALAVVSVAVAQPSGAAPDDGGGADRGETRVRRGSHAPTEPEDPLRARLQRLARRDPPDDARRALDHARRALQRETELRAKGRRAAAERARSIADAAVTLAGRRLALQQERQALRAARARVERTSDKAARARGALENTLRQRARALRNGRDAGTAAVRGPDAGTPLPSDGAAPAQAAGDASP